MTDAVAISLIGGTASVAAASLSFYNNVLARRHTGQIQAATTAIEDTKKQVKTATVAIEDTQEKMKILEKNTNSIKDELVKVTGEKAFAEGLKEGKDQQK